MEYLRDIVFLLPCCAVLCFARHFAPIANSVKRSNIILILQAVFIVVYAQQVNNIYI